jgi:hypothetical protein
MPRSQVGKCLGIWPSYKHSATLPELSALIKTVKDARIGKTVTQFVSADHLCAILGRFPELDKVTTGRIVALFIKPNAALPRVNIAPLDSEERSDSLTHISELPSSELNYYEEDGIDDGNEEDEESEPSVRHRKVLSLPSSEDSERVRKVSKGPQPVTLDELKTALDAQKAEVLAEMRGQWRAFIQSPLLEQPHDFAVALQQERDRLRAEVEAEIRAKESESIRARVAAEQAAEVAEAQRAALEEARTRGRKQAKEELLQELLGMMQGPP